MFLLIEHFYQKLIHFSALWFESKRPGLESQRRWRVSDLSRQHQGTGHASLQTHLLWRMRLDMVRQRTNMSNVQGTGETWDNHSFENNSLAAGRWKTSFILYSTDNWRSGLEGWCYFFVCPVVLRKRNHYPGHFVLNDQAIWSNLAASICVPIPPKRPRSCE